MAPDSKPVVTISASYGAGGSEIGPQLAHRLGVPFVDRAVPVAVAAQLDVPVEQAIEHETVAPATFSRWLTHFAPAVQMFGGAVVLPDPGGQLDDDAFRIATERVLREYAAPGGPGAVILGRAAAVVLRDAHGALHVRLDGPRPARLRQAARLRGVEIAAAAEEARRSDAARESYVRHWYHADPHDPSLYHLVLDGTALSLDGCVGLIERAVALRRAAGLS